MGSDNPKVKRAREILNSIYSFFVKNKDEYEPPSFVSDGSRVVPLVYLPENVPTPEETRRLTVEMEELVATNEVIGNVSEEEREIMTNAAKASIAKRRNHTA
ncbi:hypothetical protein B0I35DRAFT_180722 [Stachybotrys elegans]|uniref:Uncharacterized protein n=1 Tax=Stachybotrys elegans TaxID=80388 RepID=A0A8K0WJT7_9HYPO|nr:hypothetical protein B0I35DRAFT_180722 [Stachybotrys elegans]